MNLHLHKVISDLSGQTGISIIEAILRGERSPQKLAEYRHSRIRCSSEELRTALEGSYQDTYLFELQQAYDLFRFYEQKIQECDDQLEKQLNSYQKKTEEKPPSSKKRIQKEGNRPQFDTRSYLFQIYGVDLTQIDGIQAQTGLTFLSEVGTDLSKFKNEKHFASWLGLSPHQKISGGKGLSSRTPKVKNQCAIALRMAAST